MNFHECENFFKLLQFGKFARLNKQDFIFGPSEKFFEKSNLCLPSKFQGWIFTKILKTKVVKKAKTIFIIQIIVLHQWPTTAKFKAYRRAAAKFVKNGLFIVQKGSYFSFLPLTFTSCFLAIVQVLFSKKEGRQKTSKAIFTLLGFPKSRN